MKRVVIVTGANGGIGFATVKAILDKTDFAVLATINENEKNVRSFDTDRVIPCRCDITEPDSGEKLLDCIGAKESEFEIHGLVNNAGINRDSLFLKMDPSRWKEVIDTNLSALFNVTYPIVKYMIDNQPQEQTKYIINISSIIGESGGFGQTNYSAAKAGILGFTKSLALETARFNILVNAIAPGFIKTPMTAAIPDKVKDILFKKIPLGRFGEPEDIANTVLFLMSSRYATGSVLNINGGLYM